RSPPKSVLRRPAQWPRSGPACPSGLSPAAQIPQTPAPSSEPRAGAGQKVRSAGPRLCAKLLYGAWQRIIW
nr:hypothetical protein [Tanacetum cinerariifolium]